MRTTITLEPDVAQRVKRLARERGISFKEALNGLLRAALAEGGRARPYRLQTFKLGLRPGIDLDRALKLAEATEDEETIRKLELRK